MSRNSEIYSRSKQHESAVGATARRRAKHSSRALVAGRRCCKVPIELSVAGLAAETVGRRDLREKEVHSLAEGLLTSNNKCKIQVGGGGACSGVREI